MLDSMDTAPAIPSEIERVEQLKQMNGAAWAALLNRYTARLHRDTVESLNRRGLSADAADDIVQETWITAVKKIGHYVCTGEDKLYHWLRAIAFNHVRNLNRAQKKSVSFDEFDDVETEHGVSLDYFLFNNALYGDDVEDEVELREQLAALDRALRELKAQESDIVLRALVWLQKPQEIAEAYPMLKPRTISQIIWRAKNRIKELAETKTRPE